MANFYNELIALKNLRRRGWVLRFDGESIRFESDAEHIYSSVMLALKIVADRKLDVNQEKLIKMILVHEFGEIDAGDITPADNVAAADKYKSEEIGVKRVVDVFGQKEYLDLWYEFEENISPEAKLAKIVDKLDCVMQAKYYAEKLDKPELYAEFYGNAKEIIKDYEEYLK